MSLHSIIIIIIEVGCLLLAVILIRPSALRRRRKTESSKGHGVSIHKTQIIKCRLSHNRLFPKKHGFSYPYLSVGIPVRSPRSTRLLSVGALSWWRRGWLQVKPEHHLLRGMEDGTLSDKLDVYLRSQFRPKGLDPAEFPYAFLLTSPSVFNYSFKPASFWYLYTTDQELVYIIAEVNNTFDERRLYLFPASQGSAQTLEKDFHVSPFSSRKGSYALSVTDPDVSHEIALRVTLRSSKGHAKLVARWWSLGPSIDPLALSAVESLWLLMSWGPTVLTTFVKIVTNAIILAQVHKLSIWYRPEPKESTIGRQPVAAETFLASVFLAYLQRQVQRHSDRFKLETDSANGLRIVLAETRQGYDLRIHTPQFFRRMMGYQKLSDFLSCTLLDAHAENRTAWSTDAWGLIQAVRVIEEAIVKEPGADLFSDMAWSLFRRLSSSRPEKGSYPCPGNPHARRYHQQQQVIPSPTSMGEQCFLDAFVRESGTVWLQVRYMTAVMGLRWRARIMKVVGEDHMKPSNQELNEAQALLGSSARSYSTPGSILRLSQPAWARTKAIDGWESRAQAKSKYPEMLEKTEPRVEEGEDATHVDVDRDEVYSLSEQKSIIRRVDLRLVSVLACLYVISLVDRVNISAAAIAGLNQDLQLQQGARFSITIVTFFAAYTAFQPVGAVLTRKIGPRWFLGSITLAWGAVMIGSGFVNSWESLAGLRILVGAFEAGFFPGSVYLLSTWYTRFDMQKRYTVFYGVGCVAGALGGILAFGLSQMNGVAGLRGWRWIFIVEGVISCLIALASYVLLVEFPEDGHRSWRFLNKQECDFVIRRVNRDRGDAVTDAFSLRAFLTPALDCKIWVYAFVFFCVTTVGYSINYFLPMILLGMGFSVAASQCLVVPPWIFTGLSMYAQAWLGDKYRTRGPLIAFNAVLAIIGLVLMAFHAQYSVRYFGVFLVVAGSSGNLPPVLTYQANNIRGHWKRAFCSATLTGFGGIGGIAGALLFRSQDGPRYLPGIYACIGCNVCILLTVAGMTMWLWRSNTKARKGVVILEGLKGFEYTY
ncbi:hypothetical protein L249_1870 [Ophiocordyceps polyrhachis-furcata BCC 54312]|uniref:Major facilitator superfamily (MFS) profile domain-containing protein n=1 Tax=Ophiocordyceps polyrhachis-furcata BCC 54312 TaxID=1330021 RepID=A0A367LP51_9HYPO|nr:hypothetical protein L249_1870 [Ophiocordyceps polyrhachis-furcata BCC 54312]